VRCEIHPCAVAVPPHERKLRASGATVSAMLARSGATTATAAPPVNCWHPFTRRSPRVSTRTRWPDHACSWGTFRGEADLSFILRSSFRVVGPTRLGIASADRRARGCRSPTGALPSKSCDGLFLQKINDFHSRCHDRSALADLNRLVGSRPQPCEG
jgi:hypothetical protein